MHSVLLCVKLCLDTLMARHQFLHLAVLWVGTVACVCIDSGAVKCGVFSQSMALHIRTCLFELSALL